MPTRTDLHLPARDGRPLAATRFEPDGPARATVLVLGAWAAWAAVKVFVRAAERIVSILSELKDASSTWETRDSKEDAGMARAMRANSIRARSSLTGAPGRGRAQHRACPRPGQLRRSRAAPHRTPAWTPAG